MNTQLGQQMILRANADGLPSTHELRQRGMEFDDAAKGFLATPQTHNVKQLMGAWARALRVWCEYTGEALI
jgi:hypothetical protein